WSIHVDLFAKLAVSQQGLVQSTGAASAEIFPRKTEGAEHGEAFQGKQHLHAGFTLHQGEALKIFAQQFQIHDEGWRVDLVDVKSRGGLIKDVRRGEHGRRIVDGRAGMSSRENRELTPGMVFCMTDYLYEMQTFLPPTIAFAYSYG
ncbi:MAG: hypothetical protein ACK56I_20100, partial [bacterium]